MPRLPTISLLWPRPPRMIVNPAYGEGNTTDGDHVFSIHSKTDGADIPMVYLVAPDGTDYDKRIGIHNRGKSWVFRNTADAVWR